MVHWRHGYRGPTEASRVPRPMLTLRGVVVAVLLTALVIWAAGRLAGQAYDSLTVSRVAR
jgi:hypothetical protein